MKRNLLVSVALLLSTSLYADKELKDNMREIGHGFKAVVKGAGKAVRTTIKKTDKWLDKDENGKKDEKKK